MATTKISRRLLQALEDEQFDLLPGGIFNKSYVRSYAKCVGIDEEEAVAEYMDAAQEPPADTRVIAHQHESMHAEYRRESSRFPFVPVLVLVALVAGGVGAWKLHRERQRERQQLSGAPPPPAMTTSAPGSAQAVQDAAPAPKKQTAVQPATPLPGENANQPGIASAKSTETQIARNAETATSYTSASSPFEVTVRPKDSAWVSIKADGNYVVRGIIKPPEVKTIRATEKVIFYTGNAGDVDVAFDGKTVPLSGGPNEARVLVFNSQKATQSARSPAP